MGRGPETARRPARRQGAQYRARGGGPPRAGPLAKHIALRWLGKDGSRREFTYADLRDLTNRFANVLKALGVDKGERVFVLCGRIPELYVAVLGTLKNRGVVCTLFSAFGPEPIHTRLMIGEGSVLVTTASST